MTPESLAALADLRRGGHFEWHVVNALALVLYVYTSAARRKEWDRIALGIGFLAVELIWEMVNALVLHFTQHAALWMVAGRRPKTRASPLKRVIEMTATGIDAETVIPTFSTR